jgi:addiction module HigA family antidote
MPGEILRELFLEPRGISITRFAAAIEVSRKHMSDLVNGKVRLEPAMAGRIAKALGTSAQVWLNLQAAVDAHDAEASVKRWRPKETFEAA